MAATDNDDVKISLHVSRIAELIAGVKKEKLLFHVKHYFPTQNFPKIVSRRSSVCARPVSASKAKRA